jgi:hypothetical protein
MFLEIALMAAIVCVHGIAQQLKGEHSLDQVWSSALLDGLTRADYRGTEPSIEFAFYGDLFRKPGRMAVQQIGPSSLEALSATEEEFILSWWQAAAKTDENVTPPTASTMFRTPPLVQRALYALSGSRFFNGMSEALIRLFARQVYIYFNDAVLRGAIRDRVTQHISADTKVVVGHSLGSVIAYESLCPNPDWPVKTLVSLGSPLGVPSIFRLLEPPPLDGNGQWPVGLTRWSNVADAGDCVALEKDLSKLFGKRVRNFLVDNEAKAHDVRPYLTAVETGRAIAQGLIDSPADGG